MASKLCQKWLKNGFLLKNLELSYSYGPFDFVQISIACSIFLKNVWRDFKQSRSALAMAAWESFKGIVTAKIDFLIGHFMLPLLMLTFEIFSLAIQYWKIKNG